MSGEIYNWAVGRLDDGHYPNTATFGVVRGGKVICAIIFSKINKKNVYMSIYSENALWCTKRVLKFAHNFAFNVLKAGVMSAVLSASNAKSQSLVERLGFKLKGTITAGGFDGKDCLVYQCLKEEYKYK
jgi:hypothetical protein